MGLRTQGPEKTAGRLPKPAMLKAQPRSSLLANVTTFAQVRDERGAGLGPWAVETHGLNSI